MTEACNSLLGINCLLARCINIGLHRKLGKASQHWMAKHVFQAYGELERLATAVLAAKILKHLHVMIRPAANIVNAQPPKHVQKKAHRRQAVFATGASPCFHA